MKRILLISVCLAALLAGCASKDVGTNSHGTASVSYNGDEAGTDDDTAGCDDDATLTGTGSIDDGSIKVTVTDGDGAEQFSATYDDKVSGEAEHMKGSDGDWKLTVVRTGDSLLDGSFKGSYSFTLTC